MKKTLTFTSEFCSNEINVGDVIELRDFTPFIPEGALANEDDADRIYSEMKLVDPTRVFDATSGWFFEKESDVSSEHVYFKKIDLKESMRPLVLSEFGGYSCKIDGHVYNPEKSYGYRTMIDCDDLNRSLRVLYFDEVIPMISRGLCAAVLTQVSDIEDEINGLVTYDRQVIKVEPDTMNEIKAAIDTAFANELDKKG